MSEKSYNYFMNLNLKDYSDEWIAIIDKNIFCIFTMRN